MDTQKVARANVLFEVLILRDGLLEFLSDLSNILNWTILLSC